MAKVYNKGTAVKLGVKELTPNTWVDISSRDIKKYNRTLIAMHKEGKLLVKEK